MLLFSYRFVKIIVFLFFLSLFWIIFIHKGQKQENYTNNVYNNKIQKERTRDNPFKTKYGWAIKVKKTTLSETEDKKESLRSSHRLSNSFLWSYFPLAWPPPARFHFLIEKIWVLERWMSLLWLHRITMFEENGWIESALKLRCGWSLNFSGFT